MTNEQIRALAKQAGAGIVEHDTEGDNSFVFGATSINEFVRLVRESERERCAGVCDEVCGMVMGAGNYEAGEIAMLLRDKIKDLK